MHRVDQGDQLTDIAVELLTIGAGHVVSKRELPPTREIGQMLYLSPGTISSHLYRTRPKLANPICIRSNSANGTIMQTFFFSAFSNHCFRSARANSPSSLVWHSERLLERARVFHRGEPKRCLLHSTW